MTYRSSRLPASRYLLFFIALAIILRIASTPTANLSYLLLAAFALQGRSQAILALALSWFFTMLSPGIGAEATLGSVGRYAVLLGAAVSVFARSSFISAEFRLNKSLAAVCILGFLVLVHSVFFSPMPDVSILKAVSWMIVFATLMSAWQGMGEEERQKIVGQIFGGMVVIMLVSLPLVVLPLGYLRNGSGFQGILNHPQAFGPTMALLGTWAASRILAQSRPAWSIIGLAGTSVVLVLLSEARTAGLAMVLGIFVALVAAPILSGKRLRVIMPGLRSKRVWLLFVVVLAFGVVFAPRLGSVVENYITKSGRAAEVQSLLEAYDRSRGGLIDEMLSNIGKQPLTGIGFGIGSSLADMRVERDPIFGLPISASIEKGVMPLAVLEELGVIIAGIVGFWLFSLLRNSARSGITPLALTSTVLILNLGESTFFSPGGMGLLSMILICWAATPSGQRATCSITASNASRSVKMLSS